MERFRIALYGMTQVTAIVYGVLASGAAVKLNSLYLDHGYDMPHAFYLARFYRDHGYFLFLVVVAWALTASYLALVPTKWALDESMITITGIALTILFAIVGTYLAFAGAIPPADAQFLHP